MKILVSAYSCIPHRGSEPGIGWNWTVENARLGHEVWCFTTPDGQDVIEAELRQNPQFRIIPVYIPSSPLMNWLYRFQPFVYVHYMVWQYNASKQALILDESEKFDLVIHATMGSLQLGSGMWRLKKPFIFGPVGGGSFPPTAFRKYFHGSWAMEIARKSFSSLLLFLNPDHAQTMKHASLIFVANQDTYQMVESRRREKVKLLLDVGLPLEFFPPRTNDFNKDIEVLKILWVGRIFPRKGLSLVLESLSKVKIPFHLTIIGDGNLSAFIPVWVEQYGLQGKVTWRGHVPWEDMKKAYADHHVFMFCSLRDTFGSQFLEAAAYGLPIITLNHQGARDHIPDDAAIKVPVTTPAEVVRKLAEAVEYLYNNPAELFRLGQGGNAFAKTQTWKSKVAEVSKYYAQITRKREMSNEGSKLNDHTNEGIHQVNPG